MKLSRIVVTAVVAFAASQSMGAEPSGYDCHVARAQMGAWLATWDMLHEALLQDKYVGGIPASVVGQTTELSASIAKLNRERDALLPAMQEYVATAKEANDQVLKVCGPYK